MSDEKRESIIPPSPSAEAYRIDEDQGDVFNADDPFVLFADWLTLAGKHEANDPNSMALGTVDASGAPDVRIVLLKDINGGGLSFYTNTQSAKGEQLAANPVAALAFHWKSIRRQVRFRGPVEMVTPEEADAYFATRARGAQIGAWASDQSRVMPDGEGALPKNVARREEAFGDGEIPRPDHWSGYRLIPNQIEFWVNRPFRLHDRLLFERERADAPWTKSRLFP